jgi:hypothetical protein
MVTVEAPAVSCIQPIGVPGLLVLIKLSVPPVLTPAGVVGVVTAGWDAVAAGWLAAGVVAAGVVAAGFVVVAGAVAAGVVTAGAVGVGDVVELHPLIMNAHTSNTTTGIMNNLFT